MTLLHIKIYCTYSLKITDLNVEVCYRNYICVWIFIDCLDYWDINCTSGSIFAMHAYDTVFTLAGCLPFTKICILVKNFFFIIIICHLKNFSVQILKTKGESTKICGYMCRICFPLGGDDIATASFFKCIIDVQSTPLANTVIMQGKIFFSENGIFL